MLGQNSDYRVPSTIAKCYSFHNSSLHIPSDSSLLCNAGMETKDIRRANLLAFLAGAKTLGKTDRQFAEENDVDPAYISQIKNGTRDMGSRFARKLEQAMTLPYGYMDQLHEADPAYEAEATVPAPVVVAELDENALRDALVLVKFLIVKYQLSPLPTSEARMVASIYKKMTAEHVHDEKVLIELALAAA